jgi:O-acetyl-ADP-ribose deacetylase (regulator of RNase III)
MDFTKRRVRMIRKVQGDLLKANVQALVNTVNTVGVMGRGIALQFKQTFPENFKAYKKACDEGKIRLGMMFTVDLGGLQEPRYIINFPTKKHWRSKSRYEHIEAGLEALVAEVRRLGIESIALPPLGCGLGGLDWSEVYRRIEQRLGSLSDVEVVVYEPTGPPAAEKMKTRTARPKMTPGRAVLLVLMKRYLQPLLDDAITLLEIHKLMYLTQEAGEPLKLKYTKGVYGPYARNLHHVLERIEGHFITGYGDGREAPGKVIEYKPDAVREAEVILEEREDAHQRLERLEQLISGFETPYGMELLASTHWVAFHEDEQARLDPTAAARALYAWNERKRRLFKPEHIATAWKRLKTQDWLQ